MRMTERVDMSKRIPTGESSFRSGYGAGLTLTEYMLGPDLPHDGKKRSKCVEHMAADAAKLAVDFQKLGGLRLPEAGEPQKITTQFFCRGMSCILRDCGLQIVQYDGDGNEISRMSA